MNRWSFAVTAALAVLLGLGLVAQAVRVNRVNRDLDQMRAKVERLEARQKESATASQSAVEEVRGEIARVEKKSLEVQAPAPASAKHGSLPTLVTEEDIQKIVDDRVEQKLQAQGGPARGQGQGGGERKMALHDLAKELALDPATQAKVAGIANTAKKEIFEVIKTPRPDGTSFADDIISAVTSGNGEEAKKVFTRIFTEKIPGTDATYVAAVTRIQEDARGKLRVAMGPAYERFQHMSVTPDHIETGFDPLAEYFAQRQK